MSTSSHTSSNLLKITKRPLLLYVILVLTHQLLNYCLGILPHHLFLNVLKRYSCTKKGPQQSSRNVVVPLVAIKKVEGLEKILSYTTQYLIVTITSRRRNMM